ncbi:hypothetical protein AFR_19860 [Actinoplanes friuliensis DSM 7358]|uniref:Gram-positive cocci surface proteins LPxTG domain-containing protein n=2 Tax=Actinoplanes friuliensis TaxID=196914 RepID=U5VZD4_9ACTN|nr:hypothetical protein AFR_19860 [Actinoplanes friuliensis DSM 7358]
MWRRSGLAVLAVGAALLTATPAVAAPPATVDLRATIDGAAEAVPGELLYVRIGTVLAGSQTPTGVKMTVTLPEGVSYQGDGGAASDGAGPCEGEIGGRTVVCIPEPTEVTQGGVWWQAPGRVAESVPIGTELTTTVVVSSDSEETNPADNTATLTTRVAGPAATFLKVTGPAEPVVPGQPVRIKVRLHYGEATPVDEFVMLGSFGAWFIGGGGITNIPADCWADGSLTCQVPRRLESGTDLDLIFELKSSVRPDDYRELRDTMSFSLEYLEYPIRATGTVTFTKAPSPSPTPSSPSPSPSPTGTGTGNGGESGGDDEQASGGLPITGAPIAALATAGLLLITAGAGALLLSRRRSRATH